MSIFKHLLALFRNPKLNSVASAKSVVSTDYAAHIDIDFREFLAGMPTGFATAVVVHEPPSTVGVIATITIPSAILLSSPLLSFATEFYFEDSYAIKLKWAAVSSNVQDNIAHVVFGLPRRITGAQTTLIQS